MRRASGMAGLVLAAVLAAGAGAVSLVGSPAGRPPAADGPAPAAPQRVVSLNLCTDQLATLLLPPERIAALSFLARDADLSHVAARAAALPTVRGMAEEVLALNPDLVLAGTYTTRPTVAILKARGIKVIELGLTADFDDIRRQTREIAEALGVPERGEVLLAGMEAKLAAAAPASADLPSPGPDGPSALTFAPGGFTAGTGTLSDAVMRAAGLTNYAGTKGLIGYGYLPVETVAAMPPDLLISSSEAKRYPSLQHRMLAHPALARSIAPDARPDVPGALWTCGGPFTADAVTLLAEARQRLETGAQVAALTGGKP